MVAELVGPRGLAGLVNNAGIAVVGIAVRRAGELIVGVWLEWGGFSVCCTGVRFCTGLSRLLHWTKYTTGSYAWCVGETWADVQSHWSVVLS